MKISNQTGASGYDVQLPLEEEQRNRQREDGRRSGRPKTHQASFCSKSKDCTMHDL